MRNGEWWRNTAVYMWRKYFGILRRKESGEEPHICASDMRICDVCSRIYESEFTPADREIVRAYFSSGWGDDLRTVEDYSLKHNVPVSVIWIVIKRACRAAMVEIGLIDRKEEHDE